MKPPIARIPKRPLRPHTRQATSFSLSNPSPLPIFSLFSHDPSRIASSSKWTLDFPFPRRSKPPDPVVTSLQYATDAELYHALLVPPLETYDDLRPDLRKLAQRARGPDKWTSSIDPSSAFLALRDRPTYRQLLDHIGPCLERIYSTLLPSGMHELLASDIYLHYRDPRLLRTLLEVAAKFPKQLLRSNVIVSIYTATRAQTTSWFAPRLSDRALRHVVGVLAKGENPDLLKSAWADLLALSRPEDPPWELYSVPLYLSESGHMDMALEMFERLRVDRFTRSSIPADSNSSHLFLLSICIHAAVRLQYHDASQELVAKLVDLYPRGTDGIKLAYRVCHGALIGRKSDRVKWAMEMIDRIMALPDSPCPPNSILDAYIATSSLNESLAFYMSLPEYHHRLSPPQILHFAQADLSESAVLALVREIDRLPVEDFISARSTFIYRLIKNGHREIVRQLYDHWEDGLEVTAPFMMRLLSRFTDDRRFGERLLARFEAQSPASIATSTALAFAHNVWRHADKAKSVLESVPKDDPAVQNIILESIQEYPRAAYQTWYQAQSLGLEVDPPVHSILAACLRGDWKLLRRLAKLDVPEHEKALPILRLIQKGKYSTALALLDTYGTTTNPHADVYKLVILGTIGADRFDMAIRAIQAIPEGLMERAVQMELALVTIRRMLDICRACARLGDALDAKLQRTLESEQWMSLRLKALDRNQVTEKQHSEAEEMIHQLDRITSRMKSNLRMQGEGYLARSEDSPDYLSAIDSTLGISRAVAREVLSGSGRRIVYGNVVQDVPSTLAASRGL